MNGDFANLWRLAAEENIRAGMTLFDAEGMGRGAANRFYYAAYQASHAIILSTPLRADCPREGNWGHGALANVLLAALQRHLYYSRDLANTFRQRLLSAKTARVVADYLPNDEVTLEHLRDARSAAATLLGVARKRGV